MKYLLASIFLIAVTAPALAQEGSEPPANPDAVVDAAEVDEAARILFDAGTRAYEAGLFEDALIRYMNAYELSHRPELLYNIAVSYDRLEQKEEAADYYARFVEAVPDSPNIGIARSRGESLRRTVDEEVVRAAYAAADSNRDDSGGAPQEVENAIADAAVGIVWLLVGAGDDDDESAHLSPVVSPQVAGLEFAGSF